MASTREKYARLNGDTDSNSKQLIYPMDLTSDDTYAPFITVFRPNVVKGHSVGYTNALTEPRNRVGDQYGEEVAMQTKAGGNSSLRNKNGFFGSSNKTYVKTDETIILPMPNQINLTYAAQWQSTDIGALGRGLDFINSAKEMDFSTLGNQASDSAKRSLAGAVQSLGVANVKDYLELTTGVSQNAYTEVLFKGMGNRMIPFTYTFTPRSLKEAEVVRSILHRFKYHQAPEFKYEEGNNSYMLHPSTFDISYIDLRTGKHNQWMNRISTCALTNLSINDTPNGEFAALEDGSMAAITVDLIFTELVILSKEMMTDNTNSY